MATTTNDIIEAAAGLMHTMPEADELGVFNDEAIEAWEDQLDSVFSNLKECVHVFRMLADKLAHEAAFVKAQESLLASRRKSLEGKRDFTIDKIKRLLEAHEALNGSPKVKTLDSSWVSIRRTSKEVVRVADAEALPDAFVRLKREADKVKLMQVYKETGTEFLPPGVTVEQSHSEAVVWPRKVK